MKIKLLLILLIFTKINYAQQNFKWEKIDSIGINKNEIYSLTKMFISETWTSAKTVIDNDDKENGIILLKALSLQNTKFMFNNYIYEYSYKITFRIKENKFKITLDNVICEKAYIRNGTSITKIQPFEGENCPKTGTLKYPGLTKKKAIKMILNLKNELSKLFESYKPYLEKSSEENKW